MPQLIRLLRGFAVAVLVCSVVAATGSALRASPGPEPLSGEPVMDIRADGSPVKKMDDSSGEWKASLTLLTLCVVIAGGVAFGVRTRRSDRERVEMMSGGISRSQNLRHDLELRESDVDAFCGESREPLACGEDTGALDGVAAV